MNFLDTQPPFDIHSDPLPKLQPAKLAKYVRRVNRGLYVDPAVRAIKRRELPLVMGGQSRDDASVSNDALVIGVSMTIVCVTVGIVALVLVFSR